MKKALVFDMDGVLVDVRFSYMTAIKKTVEYFTGKTVTDAEIQQLKNQGGFNNDWDVTETFIVKNGVKAAKQDIIDTFQNIYKGPHCNGLIQHETWLLNLSILKDLSKIYILGIVTGRPKEETEHTLTISGAKKFFKTWVTMDDTTEQKPDPEPLLKALQLLNCTKGWYVGDTVDDMKMAHAAGIHAIGVIPPGSDESLGIVLKKNGAEMIVRDINTIQQVL